MSTAFKISSALMVSVVSKLLAIAVITLALTAIAGIFGAVDAAHAIDARLRFYWPVSETHDLDLEEGDSSVKLESDEAETSRIGLHFIFGSGIGIGVSSLTTSFDYQYKTTSDLTVRTIDTSGTTSTSTLAGGTTLIEDSVTITSNFLDLSYTFGEEFTVEIGAGGLVSGSGELKREFGSDFRNVFTSLTNTTFGLDSISGSAGFINLGWTLSSLELLVGFRENTVTAKFAAKNNSDIDAVFPQEDVKIKDTFLVTRVGLGWIF